jgi:hypothetical protein
MVTTEVDQVNNEPKDPGKTKRATFWILVGVGLLIALSRLLSPLHEAGHVFFGGPTVRIVAWNRVEIDGPYTWAILWGGYHFEMIFGVLAALVFIQRPPLMGWGFGYLVGIFFFVFISEDLERLLERFPKNKVYAHWWILNAIVLPVLWKLIKHRMKPFQPPEDPATISHSSVREI